MKKPYALALAAALAAVAIPSQAEEPTPPPMPGPGARGPRGPGPRMYDPSTVATLSGEIVTVEKVTGRRGEGVHIRLQTASEQLPVHLGPSWFLDKEGLKLAPGDQVEVTGSRITFGGKAAVIAQVLKKGAEAVVLRDARGVPVWAGRGAR